MRRRSAAEAPHLPGRAAQPDAADSHRAPRRRLGGGAASLDTLRVSSLSPVGPGCEVEGRGRDGRGGEDRVARKTWPPTPPPLLIPP